MTLIIDKAGQIYSEEERRKRIKSERTKYRKACDYKDMETLDKRMIDPTIESLAITTVALEECQKLLDRDGYYEKYVNGQNQEGLKRSIAAALVVDLTKSYTSLLNAFEKRIAKPNAGGANSQPSDLEKWDEDHDE